MDMTKSDVCQFLTRGTKNAHCATCAFIPYAGFSQIRSHIAKQLLSQSKNFISLSNCMFVHLRLISQAYLMWNND